MTRPSIVLVTGSRALDGHADALAWLAARLEGLAPSLVVTGDARGPDRWAARWARERGVEAEVYCLNGWISDATARRCERWAPSGAETPRGTVTKAWALRRNAVMVSDVAIEAPRAAVVVLALQAPWSKTHGTEHTVGLAREAGLHGVRRVFAQAVTA